MRRRRRGDLKSPSISDTEYFSGSAGHTLEQPIRDSPSPSEIDSAAEESSVISPSAPPQPTIPTTQSSGDLKVPAETELPDAVDERAWYEFDLSVVLALLSPIVNWLTGSDHVKNVLLILLLVFYLHQIIEGGFPLSSSLVLWKSIISQSLGAFTWHQDHAAHPVLCHNMILPLRTSIIAPLCLNCAHSKSFISPYLSCLLSLALHSSVRSQSPSPAHRLCRGSAYPFSCWQPECVRGNMPFNVFENGPRTCTLSSTTLHRIHRKWRFWWTESHDWKPSSSLYGNSPNLSTRTCTTTWRTQSR